MINMAVQDFLQRIEQENKDEFKQIRDLETILEELFPKNKERSFEISYQSNR